MGWDGIPMDGYEDWFAYSSAGTFIDHLSFYILCIASFWRTAWFFYEGSRVCLHMRV